jgi:hypothetical protein
MSCGFSHLPPVGAGNSISDAQEPPHDARCQFVDPLRCPLWRRPASLPERFGCWPGLPLTPRVELMLSSTLSRAWRLECNVLALAMGDQIASHMKGSSA